MMSASGLHEWNEDALLGSYEVSLTLDVGTADQMLELTKRLREFASELPVLGYTLNSRLACLNEMRRA